MVCWNLGSTWEWSQSLSGGWRPIQPRGGLLGAQSPGVKRSAVCRLSEPEAPIAFIAARWAVLRGFAASRTQQRTVYLGIKSRS